MFRVGDRVEALHIGHVYFRDFRHERTMYTNERGVVTRVQEANGGWYVEILLDSDGSFTTRYTPSDNRVPETIRVVSRMHPEDATEQIEGQATVQAALAEREREEIRRQFRERREAMHGITFWDAGAAPTPESKPKLELPKKANELLKLAFTGELSRVEYSKLRHHLNAKISGSEYNALKDMTGKGNIDAVTEYLSNISNKSL